MTFISYAQNFEDVILWRALNTVRGGFYIDIGAQHPINDSVSLAFYKKNWRGVHVEPTQHYSSLLRKYRPDETVIQAAVSDACSILTLYEFSNTGLSTAKENIAVQHIANGYPVTETTVQVISLFDLLEKYKGNDIHWLKIDVEGLESSVIRSWGDSDVRPWVLCIESIEPGSGIAVHLEWECLLISKGYVFSYCDGLNRFYVSNEKPDLLKYFSRQINARDDFLVSKPLSILFRLGVDRGCEKYKSFNFVIKKIKVFLGFFRKQKNFY